jgi:subtilisin family serine protease
LEGYKNAFINIINETYAVAHIALSTIQNHYIQNYGYSALPKIFGLTSEVSLEASGVFKLQNVPTLNLFGNNVLVGVVDTGIDYLNPVFQNENHLTRIVSIWDQTIESENAFPASTMFGTEYTAEQINQALSSGNPLEIVPSTDTIGHGTMMAGVAAGGANKEAAFQGVATSSELVVVKLRQAKNYLRQFYFIPEDADAYQDNDIMWGVQYCIQVARKLNRPIAICLGIGS